MCLRAFYTSIYNIRLGFIKIESIIGKEEARIKFAKKTVSLRRGEVVRLGGANRGHKTGLRFA